MITTVSELRDATATKQALLQREKEMASLRAKLEEKMGRDECAGLVASKLDKSEARMIVQQFEQLQSSVIGMDAHAQRLQDALSNASNQALDATGSAKQLGMRIERLGGVVQDVEARLAARRTELVSLTKVVRLILDDAEMRCAIDEAEGATAAEATDLLARLRGAGGRGGGAPMTVTGVTLHKPAVGSLQPLPPGAAGADKVWYKSSLLPRGEVLGHRRRLLVNARHSWIGDTCLAKSGDDTSASFSVPHAPESPRGGSDYQRTIGAMTGSSGYDCLLQATPSSTGAAPEPPV